MPRKPPRIGRDIPKGRRCGWRQPPGTRDRAEPRPETRAHSVEEGPGLAQDASSHARYSAIDWMNISPFGNFPMPHTEVTVFDTVMTAAGRFRLRTGPFQAPPANDETEEQRRTREELVVLDEARALAEVRASALLQSFLTAEQVRTLKQYHCFYIQSEGRTYRIDQGYAGNVKLVRKGTHVVLDLILATYCLHPPGNVVPESDTMLAQKLLLEADPAAFHRLANVTRYSDEAPHAPVPERETNRLNQDPRWMHP